MEHSNFHIGTIGWSYDEWVGSFYPEFTQRDRYLEEYSERFNSVEAISTAKKAPSRDSIARWRLKTPDDFKFVMTAPQSVFYGQSPWKPDREFNEFLSRCDMLGGHLGPILIELPRGMGISHLPEVTSFLKKLPKGYVYCVDPRSSDWNHDFFFENLRDCGVALAHSNISSETWRVDTADTVMLRMKGSRARDWPDFSRLRLDKTEEMKKWAARVARLVSADRPVYVLFGNSYAGFAPASAELFKRMVKKMVSRAEGNE